MDILNTYVGGVPGMGCGVFAAQDMVAGEVIEVYQGLVMPT